MSNAPASEPSTLDRWVARLQQRGFRLNEGIPGAPDELQHLCNQVRSLVLPTENFPPSIFGSVTIVGHRSPAEYMNNGGTSVKPGDFLVFYRARMDALPSQGFFDAQGEPLDDIARGIKAELFD